MIQNEIKIGGRVYKRVLFKTSKGKTIVRFGLQFYSGKDIDGKSKYSFVDCKAFEDYPLEEKQDVVVIGHLSCEDWVDKQNNKRSKLCIIVEKIEGIEPTYDELGDSPF